MSLSKKDLTKVKRFFESMENCEYIKCDRPKSGHYRIYWTYKGINKKAFLSCSGKRGFDQSFKAFKQYIRYDIRDLEEKMN